MNILLSTFGTQGDIQPFVALGKRLMASGHRVAVCTASGYQATIETHGLLYAHMSNTLLELTTALLEGRGSTLAAMRQIFPAVRQNLADEWRAAQAFAPDAIVYHPKMLASYHIAEKLAIPCLFAIPMPLYTPTRAYPTPFLAGLRLGGRFNQLSYRAFGLATAMYAGMLNAFRVQTLGLAPQRRFADLLVRASGAPVPVLYPYSPQLLPVPADYPAYVHVTGSWFLDRPADWQPPVALQKFLEAGPPPVYVGFGSGGRGGVKRAQIVLEALALTGQRGVLARGWGGLQATDLPDTVFMLDAAPHDWLFPQMAAVVHHGGAGTTAEGLRAARPTVICPFMADQPFWGRLVQEQGLGPQPIPQRRLNAPRLAEAISAAVSDTAMRQRAVALGARIRAEDGVGAATAIIERELQVWGSPNHASDISGSSRTPKPIVTP
jgi:sterol 3beta-glucosyltransferase